MDPSEEWERSYSKKLKIIIISIFAFLLVLGKLLEAENLLDNAFKIKPL